MRNYSFLILLVFFASSCASMFGESQQMITIETSNGEKAKAVVTTPDATYKKEIPTQLTINKGWGDVRIQVDDPCYQSNSVEVGWGIEPAFWLNIFNGYIGWFIDVATGSFWEYESTAVVELNKSNNEECSG